MSRQDLISRRDWLRSTSIGLGTSVSGWFSQLASGAAKDPKRKRSVILLWMNGGPSQMDTFDLKPGQKTGGPFKEIQSDVPGIRISEHLPKLAKSMKDMALIRSMKTKEADHSRGTYLLHTGRAPGGPIQYPTLGSLVAKELEQPEAELPGFISVAPYRFLSPSAFNSGFLGPRYAPLIVGDNQGFVVAQPGQQNTYDRALKVPDLTRHSEVSKERNTSRIALLQEMESDFLNQHPGTAAESHQTAYRRAVTLMRSESAKAFDLSDEPAKLRDAYGRNLFGQGCLLARRLVEQGVPFVEVALTAVPGVQGLGWDTHANNFESVKRLSNVLDPAWATLMSDLKDRGLLDSTLIVWMGEFGRTPRINGNTGRDHWANSWTTVLAGGGIKGGQVIGETSNDGLEVTKRPVTVDDFLATVCKAVGLDPMKQNNSNVGRPIRLVEPKGKAIQEVLS